MTTTKFAKASAIELTTSVSKDAPSPVRESKEFGRAFWERMGKPKWILAPMVDQSEFVCIFIQNFWPEAMLTKP